MKLTRSSDLDHPQDHMGHVDRKDEEGQDMGRHRRSAAGRAATGRATGVTGRDGSYASSYDPPEAGADDERSVLGIAPYLHSTEYAETSARSAAYLFATEDDYATVFPEFAPDKGSRRGGSRRRRKKAVTPEI